MPKAQQIEEFVAFEEFTQEYRETRRIGKGNHEIWNNRACVCVCVRVCALSLPRPRALSLPPLPSLTFWQFDTNPTGEDRHHPYFDAPEDKIAKAGKLSVGKAPPEPNADFRRYFFSFYNNCAKGPPEIHLRVGGREAGRKGGRGRENEV